MACVSVCVCACVRVSVCVCVRACVCALCEIEMTAPNEPRTKPDVAAQMSKVSSSELAEGR